MRYNKKLKLLVRFFRFSVNIIKLLKYYSKHIKNKGVIVVKNIFKI